MSKYEQLGAFLQRQSAGEVPMTFSEIERLIGGPLPPSARKHRPWWSNNSSNSVVTRAWLDAGYQTQRVDMGGEKLVFRKTASGPSTPSSPAPSDNPLAGLYGALRGTVRLRPDVDLTQPTGEDWSADFGA